MTTTALPCVGNTAIYDALFDDVPTAERQAAQTKAAALCAHCPTPCPDKVTPATGTRSLKLLPTGWMPPTTEGIAEPETPGFGKPRRKQPTTITGRDYVPPNKRVRAWARMAAKRAAQGWTTADIALDLCVTEDTAKQLLALGYQRAA